MAKNNPSSSIDNNLYDTKLIRKLGGFSEKHPYAADRDLQDRVRSHGFKWIVNRDIISDHIVLDFFKRIKHVDTAARLNDYPQHNRIKPQLKRFLFSPARGLQIALSTNYPLAIFAYPYWRIHRLLSSLKI